MFEFPVLEDTRPKDRSLPAFMVSTTRGFLPRQEPLKRLPVEFEAVESLLQRMPIKTLSGEPGLLAKFTFGDTLEKELPDLSDEVEKYRDDLVVMNALYRDYSFLASAYLFEPCHERFLRDEPYGLARQKLPRSIALPIVKVAEIAGFKPFMEYAGSYALFNYRLQDPDKGLDYDNLRLIRAFEHGLDPSSSEAGFVLVHIAMVKESGPLVKGTVEVLESCIAKDRERFDDGLRKVVDGLKNVNAVMNTMWNRSKPQSYTHFRTFIFGITSQSMFPNGVIYEGVSEEPMSFRGESGANDSMIPLCDNLLQIKMPPTPLTEILEDFRQYRPGNHREFLEAVRGCAEASGVRDFALSSPISAALYLQALNEVRDFRWRHWCFTREYILKRTMHPTATGGSPIVTWLPNQLQAVLEQMVDTGVYCKGVHGVGDMMEMASSQRETLKKEVAKYCSEGGVSTTTPSHRFPLARLNANCNTSHGILASNTNSRTPANKTHGHLKTHGHTAVVAAGHHIMTSRHAPKQNPIDRRKGESALGEFADYVQRQQALRRPPGHTPADLDEHDELSILDELGLSDDATPTIALRTLLLDPADDKVDKLAKYIEGRLVEGHGEALFDLGLEDSGDSMAFSVTDWDAALARVADVCDKVKADYKLLMTRNVGADPELEVGPRDAKDTGASGKLILRRRPESVDDVIETRIAVVGNVDAGKSTMLGVLVRGGLDDGRGKARVNLFRHKHEIESGRTSSVGMEIMGFDSKGDVVVSNVAGRKLTWEEIGRRSAKVIGFTDLAGHEKYLRTTVFGLLSSEPNYCLLMVAANNGLIGMSKEHLGIALALNVPVMVVITKIDICPPQILEQTITQLTKILKSPGARKIPIFIKNREECINTATQFVSSRICPIFQVSNVTGHNLDLVRAFLNILPHHGNYNSSAPLEFHINDTFSVPFVGTVVSGVVKSGVIHTGDTILIGPDSLGQFTTTKVRSIERKRIQVPGCSAGQSASLALRNVRRKDVRKGMVVLHKNDPATGTELIPKVFREFVAEVLILSHATTIKTKYQAMLHVGPVSQTCAIIDIDRNYIRTGDRAQVAFRFVQRPEYLTVGDRILFREGRTKGLGIVKRVGYDPKQPLNPEALKEGKKSEGG
ncbi:elongation factor Tu GTP binding domain-containing protein [Paraphaeosphaeria minitans]|uniref:Elongation factor Tu GTP binding domain-containing protein n=1 Tax=Paraphaeosphaeria minitans TaxID=565426 RepID=A0A9P6GQ32_9PLEO|nr:elongation factor Tu GTP binding domain-containing protein [Paraphaeosphaeria minitans]